MYKMFALNNVLESATQMTDLFDLMCCGWRYFESFSSHHCSYERIFVVKMLHMTSLRFFSIAYALFDILLLTGQRTICGFLFAAHNQMEVILSTRSISTFDRPSLLFHPVLYLGKLINFCNRWRVRWKKSTQVFALNMVDSFPTHGAFFQALLQCSLVQAFLKPRKSQIAHLISRRVWIKKCRFLFGFDPSLWNSPTSLALRFWFHKANLRTHPTVLLISKTINADPNDQYLVRFAVCAS